MEDMPALSEDDNAPLYGRTAVCHGPVPDSGTDWALSGFLLERAAAQNYEEELASRSFDASEPERYSHVRLSI
ncbi:MAG: hypothetical protein ACLUKO_11435 [Enterocloster bolteae]